VSSHGPRCPHCFPVMGVTVWLDDLRGEPAPYHELYAQKISPIPAFFKPDDTVQNPDYQLVDGAHNGMSYPSNRRGK